VRSHCGVEIVEVLDDAERVDDIERKTRRRGIEHVALVNRHRDAEKREILARDSTAVRRVIKDGALAACHAMNVGEVLPWSSAYLEHAHSGTRFERSIKYIQDRIELRADRVASDLNRKIVNGVVPVRIPFGGSRESARSRIHALTAS
jgi:hypothetical protein